MYLKKTDKQLIMKSKNFEKFVNLLNTGSLAHPLSRTPRDVGSIRKCRTNSSGPDPALPGGGVATFKAKPKAPGKELESLTTNVPGNSFRSMLMAAREKQNN